MKRLNSFSVFLLAALLAGCGGGGNGGNTDKKGILTLGFSTKTVTATGPVGTYHTVSVYRNDGTLVLTKGVDTSAGEQTVTLTGLPSGSLRLHAALSSGPGGAEVGSVDTVFEGGGAATPMAFVMRQNPVTVNVLPESTTVNVGSTRPLYASAKTNDGAFVYEAPSSWTWTSQAPGFATVDSGGTVTGLAEGNATIQANLAGSGLSDSVSVGVLANGVRRGKWTVMVYLNASNNLYRYALPNVNQMEKIANNPDVRFVIQWKQVQGVGGNGSPIFSGTRRYLANYDTRSALASTMVEDLGNDVDMGDQRSLTNFVDWTKAKYPADHYALVVWNHGAGWNSPEFRSARPIPRGISYDDETGSYLDLPEVASALQDERLDVLAYDACLMQGAENLMELSTVARYLVGSEENTPGPGFPYDKMFASVAANADQAPVDLVATMPAAFTNYYTTNTSLGYSSWALHLSAIDTSKIAPFRTALENFSLALTNPDANLGSLMTNVRASCTRIAPSDGYWYFDLDQVAEKTSAATTNGTVLSTANQLRTALGNMVVANSSSANGTHMRAVSIEFSKAANFAPSATAYGNLALSRLTHWDEFLASEANP